MTAEVAEGQGQGIARKTGQARKTGSNTRQMLLNYASRQLTSRNWTRLVFSGRNAVERRRTRDARPQVKYTAIEVRSIVRVIPRAGRRAPADLCSETVEALEE